MSREEDRQEKMSGSEGEKTKKKEDRKLRR
jgi:hypothetical protein